MHKWFIALLILGVVVAMLGPLRMMAADRLERAEVHHTISALAPQTSSSFVAAQSADHRSAVAQTVRL